MPAVRQKQEVDKRGTTQRIRQSIYATAVTARFFLFFFLQRQPGQAPSPIRGLINLLETINCMYAFTYELQLCSVQTTKTLARLQLSAGSSESI